MTLAQINPDLVSTLKRRACEFAIDVLLRFTAPRSRQVPADWCEANIELRTTSIKGRFSLRGREYLREPLNDVAGDCHYNTCCWGTGVGKTIKNIGQLLWVFANDRSSVFYVLPSKEGPGGAREFNNTALRPTLEATECFRDKLPTGKHRHNITGLKCIFDGNTMHLAGANSPGQLAGPRRKRGWGDEMDKFPDQIGEEASADYLINERTKQVPGSQYFRVSTPTAEGRGIWPHLMVSDLRRRFLPCPHCQKKFVLIQSAQYTVLPVKFSNGDPIPLAPLRWDKEAKRKDGEWDMDRVVRSARFECPHCGGHARDEHREWMDKHGVWLPTRNATGHRGYHLPSFYAPHVDFESSYGGMAKKFLDAQETGSGMRGYINSELAEVDVAQEFSGARIELNSAQISGADWTPLMSCDFQKLWPFLWFIVARVSSFKLQPRPTSADLAALKNTELGDQLKQIGPLAAELLRFDSRTGDFPLLDFVLAQKLTGDKLEKLFRETCGGNLLDLGRYLFRELGRPMPRGGDMEIIAAGFCELSGDDAWQELREVQQQFHVGNTFSKWGMNPNRGVVIDSGYAEEHNPEVLRKCFESGVDGRFEFYDPLTRKFAPHRTHIGCRPVPVDSWIPFKGYPIAKRWRAGGIEREWQFAPDDPFKGTSEADRCAVAVLEAASELYFHRWLDTRERQKEIQTAIAEQRPYKGNLWSVAGDVALLPAKRFTLEMFQAQLNNKGRDADGNIWERGQGGTGKRRYPDHLNDCCRNLWPLAESHGFFSYETKGEK